uniref:C-type lectin domain-containing protein n=1 Tax=Kryptolebias marmoratus TaxID=37003 RepID=A0A3Q2ZHN1_KRYMA
MQQKGRPVADGSFWLLGHKNAEPSEAENSRFFLEFSCSFASPSRHRVVTESSPSRLPAVAAQCQPCRTGWVLFEEKCYLFTDQNHYWKSWGGSRRFCQSEAADLVVVDSQREQVRSDASTFLKD